MVEHVSDYLKLIEEFADGYISPHLLLSRGVNNTDYELLPSVYRRFEHKGMCASKYLNYNDEKQILQQFIADASSSPNTPSLDDHFAWLEYAQHYGVPTRLLDWTSNPLVALFFACGGMNENDGKVYVLRHSNYMQKATKNNRMNDENTSLKQEVQNMIWNKDGGFRYPLVFRPYHLDRRMSAQSSFFMVWGNEVKSLEELIKELESESKGTALFCETNVAGETDIYLKCDTALNTITISAHKKKRLLKELDRVGISYSTLFPGLDGIGKTIEWRCNIQNNEDFLDLP